MTTRTHPWPSIATRSASRSATTSDTAGCAGSRSAPPTSPARRFPGFPVGFELDKTHRVDVTQDFRSDHDRLFHPGNQDRAASRVRPGDGQGGVRRPARRPAADRGALLRRLEAEGQHIGLVPGGGPQGMTSPVAYWHVPDIEAKLAEVTAAGATVKEPAHDVGGGRLVASVTDPDGNVLGLIQDR